MSMRALASGRLVVGGAVSDGGGGARAAALGRPLQHAALGSRSSSSSSSSRTLAAGRTVLHRQQQQWRQQQQQWQLPHRRRCHLASASAAAAAAAAPPSPSGAAAPADQQQQQQPEQQQQQQQQQQATASLSLTDLWLLLRHDKRRLFLCLAATAVSVSCAVMVPPCLGAVVDTISRGTATTPRDLALVVGRLGGVYVVSNVCLAIQAALALALGESMAHRLRSRLFGALLRRGPLFFDSVRTGQLSAWLGQDVEVLQSTVAKLLGARGIRSAFETTGIIVVLSTLSWTLALVLLLSAPLLTPVIARLSRQIGAASKASQAAANDVSATASEVVENMRIVKVFAQQQSELSRFDRLLEAAHQLSLKVLRLQAVLDASSRVRNTLCVLVTLGLGAYMAVKGDISIGTCYAFLVMSFSFTFALGNLTNAVGDVARAAGAISRARTTLEVALGPGALAGGLEDSDAGGQTVDASEQPGAHGDAQLPEGWQGDIEFRGVRFSHPGGWSLRNVSFTIPAGKTVALVGPSGGGKSTIASILEGFYPPTDGEVLVAGTPLAQLDLSWWRRQLGVVAQEPGLLVGRVADVIRYGAPGASDAEVEWAARVAQAHNFIAALPQGYQTEIGAGSGVELSGGQRQRVAIARALLPRPRVLIFDEATSALDVETEQGVTRELEAAGHATTTLVIAHRLSTVRRADSIVVVAGGAVVEQGNHEQLMAHRGVYFQLVSGAESRGADEWDMPAEGGGGGSAPSPPEQQHHAVAA